MRVHNFVVQWLDDQVGLTDPDHLGADADFSPMLDNFDFMELVDSLMDEFNVDLSDVDFRDLNTINKIEKAIQNA